MGKIISTDTIFQHPNWNFWNVHNVPLKLKDIFKEIDAAPSVNIIPRDDVKEFILDIQKIKDNHNDDKIKAPINYGTICGILIEGYNLLNKYKVPENGTSVTVFTQDQVIAMLNELKSTMESMEETTGPGEDPEPSLNFNQGLIRCETLIEDKITELENKHAH